LLAQLNKLSYDVDGSGALMAFPPSFKGVLPAFVDWDAIKAEIEELTGLKVLFVMVNILPPGVIVPVHRDWLDPNIVGRKVVPRYHLPVLTNNQCRWWDDSMDNPGDGLIMEAGYWWGPVPYWRHHQVWNCGIIKRVHIVVDLDGVIDGKYE